jgi:hypothetical protein
MSNRPEISLFRVPRTGSTLAKRVLSTVFEFPANECCHDVFRPTAPLVVTVRDWRDVVYSQWRIRWEGEEVAGATLNNAINVVDHRLRDLRAIVSGREYYTWYYEKIYNAPWATAHEISQVHKWATGEVGRRPAEIVRDIEDVVRVHSVRREQEALEGPTEGHAAFNVVDESGMIHKNHIGTHNGRPGAWREAIPERFHDRVTNHYEEALQEWGYTL